MPGQPNILVVMGSVRAGRRCPQITNWLLGTLKRLGPMACEVIDLREWHLPADDEPGIPAQGGYSRAHTRAWSAKVAGADGIVIVSPQYNWGYPAALKNALDHLYLEWRGKPLVIVTYGGHGGGKCADQLRQVAAALKLRPVETMPGITVPRELIETDSAMTAAQLQPFEASVAQAFDELGIMLQQQN